MCSHSLQITGLHCTHYHHVQDSTTPCTRLNHTMYEVTLSPCTRPHYHHVRDSTTPCTRPHYHHVRDHTITMYETQPHHVRDSNHNMYETTLSPCTRLNHTMYETQPHHVRDHTITMYETQPHSRISKGVVHRQQRWPRQACPVQSAAQRGQQGGGFALVLRQRGRSRRGKSGKGRD